jgi:CheY-like chemotaxis protein
VSQIDEVTILLVEDDPGHARLIEKNLRRANVKNRIDRVTDGQQAVDYLFCVGDYADNHHASPLLVLLDLNMPVLNGYQVLERMKADERTKNIPVIILTTTDDPHEASRCYELGCDSYVTKPVEYEQFAEAMRKLGSWLSANMIPDGG